MEEQERASNELTDCVKNISAYTEARLQSNITCLDTGDGMILAFEGNPTAPAQAALQIAQCRGPAPDRQIRMGLHSGPVTRVTDINGHPNFKGVGVNVAQRIMDCAAGGHIMLTEHYASIIRSYEGWSERIIPRGTQIAKHGLKIRVCELRHDFAGKIPLSEKLHQPIRPVPAAVRWLGILALIALCATSIWTVVMYGPPSSGDIAGSSAGGGGLPNK